MRASLIAKQELRARLDRIPVLKLPPSKLEPCLKVLASCKSGDRKEIVAKIISDVYPGFDAKRSFRALVAPALTRLHFARSEPPAFRSAPNGRIWQKVKESAKQSFVSRVLFDLATVGLSLSSSLLPPAGSLRETAKQFGGTMVDRVRGFDSFLRFYHPYHVENTEYVFATVDYFAKRENDLVSTVTSALQQGRMLAIDQVRHSLMERMLADGVLVSSFVVDEWLKTASHRMEITAFRSAYATIDSLIMNGHSINAIMLSGTSRGLR